MAKKGGSKALKRYAVSKVMWISPKEGKWAIKTEPGPHNKETSVPLGFVLRDLIKIGETMREVKVALKQRKVKVNGIVRTSHKFPTGLFDIISIDGIEHDYKMVYDLKGRLVPEKIEKVDKVVKLSKVVKKTTVKGGKLQLTTNDGRNILTEDSTIKPHDTLELELPKQKVLKVLKMRTGAKVYIIGGSHAGEQGVVKEIKPGTEKAPAMVTIKTTNKEFQTTINNVFVIGE